MCYAIKESELSPRLSDYKFITISSLRQAVIKVVWICNQCCLDLQSRQCEYKDL